MPVFAVIAIAIRLTSKGPALFKQERAAENGREFVQKNFSSQVLAEKYLKIIEEVVKQPKLKFVS